VSECNVRTVNTLGWRYPDSFGIGYSSHAKGPFPSILAVSQGARAIEVHITVDRTLYGSDQAASLEPSGLHRLCRDAREVNMILGDGIKKVYDSEKPIIAKLRRK
jgi:N-acetylneuraminate synthase